jgi:hypothetical protein
MSRQKKSIPKEVQIAQHRVTGMVSIEETLDLGNGVSIDTLKAAIKAVVDEIAEYNTMISNADAKSNRIDVLIEALNDLSSRALKGVESKYGRDSDEYEKAGGTRTSDRKRPGRKKAEGGGPPAMK